MAIEEEDIIMVVRIIGKIKTSLPHLIPLLVPMLTAMVNTSMTLPLL